MYDANQIADWFLSAVDRDAGDSITHLKLQKLVYYAQAWALALLGNPLFDEDFRAWAHGPVALTVWHRFKNYGWEAVPADNEPPEFEPEVEDLLRDVMKAYGEHSAKALEDLTHEEEPWLAARGNLPPEAKSNAVISKDVMRDFYRRLYSELEENP
jgi:uncharacterized phage-associated protein